MNNISTFQRWPQELRLTRGLFNGERIQLARESRGMQRHVLARKLSMPAQELATREAGWCFWTEQEQALLVGLTEYPIAFFVQDEPPVPFSGFLCGHDEEGNGWCEFVSNEEK